MSALRIVVVDDHPVFRMGMSALLASIDGFEIVGEAADADGAVSTVTATDPDVVIMDLHLGETSGIEATRRLAAVHPRSGVLVVTMLDDADSVFAAMRAGARGYLLKGADPAEIERAIRAVANGEVLLGPAIASKAMTFLSRGGRRGPEPFP
ncbi:MAG TPA: response regulator transcription factor, partial [Ilumatobacteraceae bacterium]